MIAMCWRLPSRKMSATITSADANPSPSATQARSSNQLGATRNHYTTEVGRGSELWSLYGAPWLPPVANHGKAGYWPKRLKQAKTVAAGCDQLPFGFHGKEGVDGSSPSEGSAKAPEIGAFSFASTCKLSNVVQVGVSARPRRSATTSAGYPGRRPSRSCRCAN